LASQKYLKEDSYTFHNIMEAKPKTQMLEIIEYLKINPNNPNNNQNYLELLKKFSTDITHGPSYKTLKPQLRALRQQII
jgi:hypothetical protein